jgi:hypothetical protein
MSEQDVKYQMEPKTIWLATKIIVGKEFCFPLHLVQFLSKLLDHFNIFFLLRNLKTHLET